MRAAAHCEWGQIITIPREENGRKGSGEGERERKAGEVLQQCHSADARLASGQTDPLVLFLLSLCVCVCFLSLMSAGSICFLHTMVPVTSHALNEHATNCCIKLHECWPYVHVFLCLHLTPTWWQMCLFWQINRYKWLSHWHTVILEEFDEKWNDSWGIFLWRNIWERFWFTMVFRRSSCDRDFPTLIRQCWLNNNC